MFYKALLPALFVLGSSIILISCKSLVLSDIQRSQRVGAFLKANYGDALNHLKLKERIFKMLQVDLNGDQKKEAMVYLISPGFCGSGGCNLLVLSVENKLITEMTVFKPPLCIQQQDNKWAVLWVKYRGKAIPLVYKNGVYPTNRTVVDRKANDFPKDTWEVPFDSLPLYSF